MTTDRESASPHYQQTGFVYYVRQMLRSFLREPGTFAHAGHRFTGLVLTFYLLAHIIVISNAAFNETRFDDLMAQFHQPIYLLLDWLLWSAFSFHALNGIRVILFDQRIGLDHQAQIFWVVMLGTLLLMAAALFVIWPEVVG